MADYTLSAKITGDSSNFSSEFDKAQEKIKGFNDSADTMGDKLKDTGKNMMGAGAKVTALSTPIMAMGKQVFDTGMEFEASMSNVQAITQGTEDELSALTETAREMGSSTRYSASEASEAMGTLALSGMDAEQVIATIPDTLNFATAAGIELGRSAEIVSGNLNAFGLEVDEAQRVTDVFAQAQASSAMDAEQLAGALEKVAPMASSMGHEIEGTSALLGILANNEIKGARAGTMLSRVYKDITDSAEEGKIAIGEHSIEVFDAQGNMRNMTSIVADVAEATEGLSGEQKQSALSAVFQGQSMDALLPLLNSGADELLGLEEALYNATGSAEEMRNVMDDNLAGSVAGMSSSFDELKLRLFDVSEGAFGAIVAKITDLLDWLGELDDSTLGLIAGISGIVVVAGPLIMLAGMLTTAIGALLSPVGAVIAVIAGLVAVGVALYANWETIKNKATEIWEGIKNFFSETWASIKDGINSFLEPITDWFSNTWDSIKETTSSIWEGISDFFGTIWEGITDVFNFALEVISAIVEGAFTLIVTYVKLPLEVIKAVVTTIWNYIGDFTLKAWEKIKEAVSKPVNAIKDFVSTGFNAIKDITSKVWDSVSKVISSVWESIKSTVSNAINTVSNTISNIWNSIKSTTSSVWNSIKTAIMTPINSARDIVGNTINTLSNNISNVFNSIRSTATNIFNNVREAMVKPINTAKDTISNIIDSIKGFFSNLRLKFPKIEMPKLPRFSLDGKFSLKPPSVPRLKVNWRADGAIFTSPYIFGNQGVGEAGPEAVLPIEKLGSIMADTLDRMGYSNDLQGDNQPVNTNVYVDINDANIYDSRDIKEVSKELATEIGREIQFG